MSKNFQERVIGDLQIIEVPGDPDKGTIILLHGFGADAFDLFPLSGVCKGPTWIFPQGPLQISFAQGYTGRAWFPVDIELLSQAIREGRFDEVSKAFPEELGQACEIIDDLIVRLNLPRAKLVLGGFSQGAVLATETVLKSFERLGGLLIFSGTLINELNWKRLAPLQAKTPFFQSHGVLDPLLPMQKAEELKNLLVEGGLKGTLHSFQGGHEIPHSILIQLSTFLKNLFI